MNLLLRAFFNFKVTQIFQPDDKTAKNDFLGKYITPVCLNVIIIIIITDSKCAQMPS